MGWKLWLDDMRPRPDDSWLWAKSSAEARAAVKRLGAPSRVAFDHDLGPGDEAIDFARELVERDLDAGYSFLPADFAFSVHSDNGPGAANLRGLLSGYLASRQKDIETGERPAGASPFEDGRHERREAARGEPNEKSEKSEEAAAKRPIP
jgi:hypothetical protein